MLAAELQERKDPHGTGGELEPGAPSFIGGRLEQLVPSTNSIKAAGGWEDGTEMGMGC